MLAGPSRGPAAGPEECTPIRVTESVDFDAQYTSCRVLSATEMKCFGIFAESKLFELERQLTEKDEARMAAIKETAALQAAILEARAETHAMCEQYQQAQMRVRICAALAYDD